MENSLTEFEVSNTKGDLVFPKREYRVSSVAKHGRICCRQVNAGRSFEHTYGYLAPTSWVSPLRTTAGSPNTDSDILRQELHRVHVEETAATRANDADWRQEGWRALNRQQMVFGPQPDNMSRNLMIVLKLLLLKVPLKHIRTCSTSYSGLSKLLERQFVIGKWCFSN